MFSIPDDQVDNRRRSGRITARPDHYYINKEGLENAPPEEAAKMKVDLLRRMVTEQMKFTSLFEVLLIEAERQDEDFYRFVESGGLNKLFTIYRRINTVRTPGMNTTQVRKMLCAPAIEILKEEFDNLTSETESYKVPLNTFSPKYIAEFSFESIYQQMQTSAPTLIDLFSTLCEKPPPTKEQRDRAQNNPARGTKDEQLAKRAEQRRILVAVSILGRQVSQRFNAIQGPLGYFLFASKTNKEVIAVLNKLGICPSYNGIITAVKSTALAARAYLRQIGPRNEAGLGSWDNLAYTPDVKLQTMFNIGCTIVVTTGYFLIPHKSLARPMFDAFACNYSLLGSITIHDFLITTKTHKVMADSSRSLVWGILKRFAKEKKFIKLPKLDYPMPILYKANLDALAEICCLRTYPYNEGVVNDTIKIIEAFVKDIGLSTEQRKTCIIPLRGDLMTVLRNR
jgi:hypothetical protein